MKKFLVIAGLVITGSACTATAEPLPQKGQEIVPEPSKAASTCDVVREALLTGTEAEKTEAMQALVADKTADATAREYAQYWLTDGARGASEAQETSAMVIRSACSI